MMLKNMNFKNDSHDEQSQLRTESLRVLDMMVHQTYCKNMSKSCDPKYKPNIVIYIGYLEYLALMELMPNNPEITDGLQYRGFTVNRVIDETHCSVFCTNPPQQLSVMKRFDEQKANQLVLDMYDKCTASHHQLNRYNPYSWAELNPELMERIKEFVNV